MKTQFLSIISIFIVSSLFAQEILNADFENWSGVEPDNWGTPNQATSLLGITMVTETSDAFSGSSAIRLEAADIPLVGAIPGFAATGAINIDIINFGVDFAGGHPYKFRPTHIGGVYKNDIAGSDTCSIQAMLTKSTGSGGAPDVIAQASLDIIASSSNYTPFMLSFTYNSTDHPDSIMVVFATSKVDINNPGIPAATTGTWLQVDSLWLIEPFEAYFEWSGACIGSASIFEDYTSGDPTSWSWDFGDGTTDAVQNPNHTYTATGNYDVQLITSNGTDTDTMMQTISINDLPTISVTPAIDTICNGTSTSASASGGATYSWSPSSGVSNPNSASPSLSPTTSTTYTVTGTSAQGCSSTADIIVWVVDCTGVNELSSLNEMNIFPNPASSILNLQLDMQAKDDLTLTVLDNSGKEMFTNELNSARGTVNEKIEIENWPQGIYYIQLSSENGLATQSFMVQ